MSWTGMDHVLMEPVVYGFGRETKVDLGNLGHIFFLRLYMTPAAEKMGPLELGRYIDDGLVEYLKFILHEADQDEVDYQVVYSNLREVEDGIMDPPAALLAFKEDLRKREEVPLASETYLKLARRHVNRRTGQGTTHDRRLLSYDETRHFARVMLLPFMKEDFWDMDWNRRGWHRGYARMWLIKKDPGFLSALIENSRVSQPSWDALELICEELTALGEEPPQELLKWNYEAKYGIRKRPEEEPAPCHRRHKEGYAIRDNELRHYVQLLKAAGVTVEAACGAVEDAFPIDEVKQERKKTLTAERIKTICAMPSTTLAELMTDAMKFVEPKLFECQYGSSSDDASSQSQ